jgi:hypothetical protein
MYQGHAALTCSIDMGMPQGHEALTKAGSKDVQHGHAARTCSIDMACGKDIQHVRVDEHSLWKSTTDKQH